MAALDIHGERQRERWYSYLLAYGNIQDVLSNPLNNRKIASNWTQVSKTLDKKENLTFLSLKELTIKLIEKCQTRPWYKKLTAEQEIEFCRDVQTYLAYHIWDFKRKSGNILVDAYWHEAIVRHLNKNSRMYSHEGTNHGYKQIKKEMEGLVRKIVSEDKQEEVFQKFANLLDEAQIKANEKIDELFKGDQEGYLPVNYDGDRTRPQIEQGEPFPEDQLDEE